MKKYWLLFFLLNISQKLVSQDCSSMNIQLQSDIPSSCSTMVMTMIHDERPGKPFIYIANKEGGLKIYNISNLASPLLIASVPVTGYGSLHVMNLSQDGNFLYLAIGNSFTNPQQGGMAIIDITDPSVPVVRDFYIVPGSANGAGIVKVEGNYAYLGAMGSGLVILDISDKTSIQKVAQYMPDINWPVKNPNPDLYNARGMEVRNSIVFLCFDAGGLRIINCTNKSTPVETGRFVNPKLYQPINLPRAYNNIVVDDTLAFVAVDYCGLEVLNIKDTSDIKLTGWWNPYNCPNNNWFTSPVHANEIVYNKQCKYAFLSTGKSDMMVINLANPASPDSCNFYGGVVNNIGTWGVGTYQNQLYLSYICALIPFSSNWTGVKILTYNQCASGINDKSAPEFSVAPNPFRNTLTIYAEMELENSIITFSDMTGKTVLRTIYSYPGQEINTSLLYPGFYHLNFQNEKLVQNIKVIKYE